MPPKKGKGKKVNDDDDAYWEAKAAKSTPAVAPKPAADESEDEAPAPAKGTGFAALALEDDDEAGGGGLMAALAKSSKKKDKKKNKRVEDDFDGDALVDGEEAAPVVDTAPQVVGDDEWPEEDTKKSKKGKKDKKGKKSKQQDDDEDLSEQVSALAIDGESTPTAAVPEPEIQAVGDDEWPEEDVKPKKGKGGKKGGKKSKAQDEEDEEVAPAAPAAEAAASPAVEDEGDDEPAGGEVKILSKKEKEKLKKEKEKAKKKAQLAAKKATTADDSPAPPSPSVESTPTPASAPAADADADEDDDAEGGAGGDKKKNKKKKKKTTAPVEEAPAAKAKPLTGRMAAIKAAMEEKKRLEEEAAKKAEDERKRIEEEDARLAEQERMAEEIKQKKKEKEKAKKELAKKEGRLLTPKQRQEKAAAEARLQALLASGVKIEGLQKDDGETAEEAPKPKKVVYGNKKKKGPAPKGEEKKEEQAKVEEVKKVTEAEDDEDDWDKSDKEEEVAKPKEEEKKKDESDGDDWDVSSEEEEEAKPEPVKAPEPKPTPAAPAKSAAPTTSKSAPSAAKPTNGKKAMPAAAVAEESSEEDSDSDDDSDSDSDSDSEDDSSEEDSSDDEVVLTPAQRKIAAKQAEDERLAAQKKKEARELREKRHEQAMAARSKEDLRSPICCILGHVDTGKTKLLDKIRQTNVQEGEAGGITQQIGATYFPVEAIKTKTEVLNKDGKNEYKIPGLLIIDTPGHESFSNLRTRGSSLCNIAILVVDLMHGLEPQTLESLKLLRDKKTPFIVALNKIDRIYGWKATPNGAFQESLAGQTNQVKREFADRVEKTILAFAEQGMNSCLYYDNKNLGRNVSLVPTSAITGEGIPDMIMLLVNLTQQRMAESLMYISELECTVLEVKVIEGLGTTIDVVLSNGYLREGDRIVVCGLNGPIYTNVRALLTPQPLREMRIKSAYVHHKEVKAALGVKITAPDLEKAIAGSRLLVVGPDDDEEDLGDEVMADLKNLLSWVDKSGRGVSVQASTLGSLEALLDFLKVSKIPVSTINIGPVHKRDVIQASTMLEKAKELACMLCFDVPVDKDAEALADSLGVRLFKADIIYHLFDKFTAYNKSVVEERKAEAAAGAFWPCRLKILQTFARRDPIVLGVDILDGTLRVGTPLCVVKVEVDKTTTPPTSTKTIIDIGRITSIEKNHETFTKLSRKNIGAGAAIKVEAIINQAKLAVGRHFDESDELYSHVTRNSIDVLKEHFRSEAEPSDWALIKKLKPLLDIP